MLDPGPVITERDIRKPKTGNRLSERGPVMGLYALAQSHPQFSSGCSRPRSEASQAERRIAQPQLKITCSQLRLKQRVLRSRNRIGLW
jgi:hypothetical protein